LSFFLSFFLSLFLSSLLPSIFFRFYEEQKMHQFLVHVTDEETFKFILKQMSVFDRFCLCLYSNYCHNVLFKKHKMLVIMHFYSVQKVSKLYSACLSILFVLFVYKATTAHYWRLQSLRWGVQPTTWTGSELQPSLMHTHSFYDLFIHHNIQQQQRQMHRDCTFFQKFCACSCIQTHNIYLKRALSTNLGC
jgi:hypothetical protein